MQAREEHTLQHHSTKENIAQAAADDDDCADKLMKNKKIGRPPAADKATISGRPGLFQKALY